jgi:hypothetical protein
MQIAEYESSAAAAATIGAAGRTLTVAFMIVGDEHRLLQHLELTHETISRHHLCTSKRRRGQRV